MNERTTQCTPLMLVFILFLSFARTEAVEPEHETKRNETKRNETKRNASLTDRQTDTALFFF